MKYLKLFDSYSFKQTYNIDDKNIDNIFYWRDYDDKDIFYEFTNKKGIEFLVVFENVNGFDDLYERNPNYDPGVDDATRNPKTQNNNCVYTRTYKIKNEKIEKLSNSGDPYDIVDTLSKITIDFIKKYNPLRIIIEHIPSNNEINREKKKKKKEIGLFSGGFPREIETIRAKFNKKSLMKYLPNDYAYRLEGSKSFITKKGEDW